MGELASNIRQAIRFALRNPGFTAAAALTLGLGIGASSAVFSVLNTLTLKPLAYVDSRQVCLLRAWDEARNRESFSMPLAAFVALAPEAPSFEGVAAYRYGARDSRAKARRSARRPTASRPPPSRCSGSRRFAAGRWVLWTRRWLRRRSWC